MKYKITNILHSGRKGVRDEPVADQKYNGLVGSVVVLIGMDIVEDCKQFDKLSMIIISSDSNYYYWDTSAVISIARGYCGEYHVETLNAIYILEEYVDE